MANETGKLGAELTPRDEAIVLLGNLIERCHGSDIALRAIRELILDHWQPERTEPKRDLREGEPVQIGNLTFKFWHYNQNDCATVRDASGDKVVVRIENIKRVEPERTNPIETRIVNLADPPYDYKTVRDLLNAEREIVALKSRVEALEKRVRHNERIYCGVVAENCAPDAPKTTMPSAEEQK